LFKVALGPTHAWVVWVGLLHWRAFIMPPYEGLEILGPYCNKRAIKKNLVRYKALMEDSARAGEVLWNLFHVFGNVAVEKNKAHMDQFGIPSFANRNFPKSSEDQSPYGFASNLASSSNGFYNHQHKDNGNESELPLAFAMVLPTSKKTGEFAPKGYKVHNGQFIFCDIQIALNFPRDSVCLIIF
jgi:hypothetical protein